MKNYEEECNELKNKLDERNNEIQVWKQKAKDLKKEVETRGRRDEEETKRAEEELKRLREEVMRMREEANQAKGRWREKEARSLKDFQEIKETTVSGFLFFSLSFLSLFLLLFYLFFFHYSIIGIIINIKIGIRAELEAKNERKIAQLQDEHKKIIHAKDIEIEHAKLAANTSERERLKLEKTLEKETERYNNVSFINVAIIIILIVFDCVS